MWEPWKLLLGSLASDEAVNPKWRTKSKSRSGCPDRSLGLRKTSGEVYCDQVIEALSVGVVLVHFLAAQTQNNHTETILIAILFGNSLSVFLGSFYILN